MTDEQSQAKVTIRNLSTQSSEDFSVRRGMGFQALCTKHQTSIEFDCREADCGICMFRVVSGMENLSKPTAGEKDFLNAMKAAPNERLACQTRIFGDLEIELDDYSVPGL